MRRTAALVVGAAGLVTLGLAGPAQADELPEHGHVLVLGVQWDGDEPVGFRKCIDLAGGTALGLNAHHAHAHQGKAGEALFNAGHIVAPTSPLWPEVTSCADLEEMFGS